jgi:hypothetical protein
MKNSKKFNLFSCVFVKKKYIKIFFLDKPTFWSNLPCLYTPNLQYMKLKKLLYDQTHQEHWSSTEGLEGSELHKTKKINENEHGKTCT